MVFRKLLLSLFIIFRFNILAQNVSVGPTVGLNLSKINRPESVFKPGFNGGIFLNYSTKTDFGLNGSVLYSQFGTKGENTTNQSTFNYLQVPINLVYYFGEGVREGSFRPKVFIGPYLGLLQTAKSSGFSDTDAFNLLNSTDFGAQLGAGFNYALKSKTWLNLELKYTHGLAKVPKIFDYENRALSLNVGISFPLGTYDKKTGKMK